MKTKFLALLAGLLFAAPTLAQAAPTVSLSVTVGAGNVPALTWSAPWATACTASGNWGGSRANAGTATGTAISGTATFALACTAPADTTATLHWVAPTTNTDGTALTDLAGFNIYSGLSAASMAKLAAVGPTLTSYQAINQPSGTVYFYMTAFNAANVESAKSLTVNKVFGGAAQSASASITVTMPTTPVFTISTP